VVGAGLNEASPTRCDVRGRHCGPFCFPSRAKSSSHSRQREKEKELLYVGDQFREAIALYYQRTPGTVKRYPEKLEELLEDKALPQHAALPEEGPRRPHDRKVPVGNHRRAGGGIMGVLQPLGPAPDQICELSMPG